MTYLKKTRIAFFIGSFPRISESWFIEQLTMLLDMGADIDIFAFQRGGSNDISEKIIKYRLLDKCTYLEYPNGWLRRLVFGLYYFLKVLILKPRAITSYYRHLRSQKQGITLKYLFWIGPLIGKINNYEVVHCHFGMIANRYLNIRSILGLKQKFITTIYGQDSSKYIKQKGLSVYDNLKRECEFFLLMTEEMKERFLKFGFPEEKLLVHYTGINPESYEINHNDYDPNDIFRIISVGRFVEKKGMEDSIRAISQVIKINDRVELNIVGGGDEWYAQKLKDLVMELGLEKQVKFLGMLPHKETLGLFKKMHLIIQLSKCAQDGDTDDLPFVLLEACYCGLPVIATNHVGIPDGVEDGKTGFLVSEGDYMKAAEKIIYFINTPDLLSNFSAEATKFVDVKFSLKNLNQRLISLYNSLK